MASIILFHSALGRRPSIIRLAAQLEAAGHRVHTPDLYDGHVFDDLEEGVAHRDELGIPELMSRAQAAVEGLPTDVVYAGLSMGAASATFLALTRPGARGAVLLHGVIPPQMTGVEAWPETVPVLVHGTAEDPWVEDEHVALFHQAVPAEVLEEHVHPGRAHLFTDEDGAEHDPEASAALISSVQAFLAQLDGGQPDAARLGGARSGGARLGAERSATA